jgi:mono/diheme cytochrome c family protein
VPAKDVNEFDTLFKQNCAGCHGADGTRGPAPALNDPLFRALIPVKEVERIIRLGREGTLMPAFDEDNGGTLNDVQIQVLTYQIKGMPYKIIEKRDDNGSHKEAVPDEKGTPPKWGVPPSEPGAPPYLAPEDRAGDKANGEKVFGRACACCHGEEGKGGPAGAIQVPAFLDLVSNQVLRRITITGRPDLGMPNYRDAGEQRQDFKPLTAQEITDLGAYLASWKPARVVKPK